jgi:ribosomal protein S18 acetylase RimI-like enzyme
MVPTPYICEGKRSDIDTLTDFNCAMALETEDKPLDPERVKNGVTHLFDRPERGFYLVAKVDQQTVASLMITTEWSDWRDGDFWWIQSVYVRPEWRRQGIFKALYQEVGRRAREHKQVCGLRLYVEVENQTAQQTYTALGMHRTSYHLFETEWSP